MEPLIAEYNARPGNQNAYKADRWSIEDRGHETACWVWKLAVDHRGYGRVMADGKVRIAHRWYYVERFGEITAGLVLDHLCNVKACVNPDHLEPVTQRENVRRARARRLPIVEGA